MPLFFPRLHIKHQNKTNQEVNSLPLFFYISKCINAAVVKCHELLYGKKVERGRGLNRKLTTTHVERKFDRSIIVAVHITSFEVGLDEVTRSQRVITGKYLLEEICVNIFNQISKNPSEYEFHKIANLYGLFLTGRLIVTCE